MHKKTRVNTISKDFKIDFENKNIYHNPKGGRTKHTIRELYSFLQNIFDNPKNMKYEIPIEAKSRKKYFLINGWTMNESSLKYLKEGTLKSKKAEILKL